MKLEIKSEVVPRSKAQRFKDGGRLHRNVRIFLVAEDEADLDKIVSAEYELHPTFRERHRRSLDRFRNFEIRIWSYGYFKTKAVVRFEDGSTTTVQGFVRW